MRHGACEGLRLSSDPLIPGAVGLMSGEDDEETLERGHKYMTNLFLSHVHNQERVRPPPLCLPPWPGAAAHAAPPPQVYPHVTCATDSENMRHVLDSTKLIILKDKIDTSTFM